MSPAFSSTRQAAAFALLLLLLLLLPVLAGKSWLPPRERIYSSLPWGAGAFPYIHDQIFEEKEDIDIAFMGSSRLWWGIDTPRVQAELSEKLGRQAVVRSLCWNSPGFDAFYFILQDLLQHRKVHVIVFCDLSDGAANAAHAWAPRWFRLADNAEALAGLPWRSKPSFYASAVLGMPRNLLGLLRANLPAVASPEISWGNFTRIENPSRRLGSLVMNQSLTGTFARYAPQAGAGPADVCIYSDATRQSFHFSGNAIPPMQSAFARKIADLARAREVKLVCLHLPTSTEMKSSVIEEPVFWPDFFQGDVTLAGIPPARLWAGMAGEDIPKLFWNYEHLNQNGQEYFTAVIAPALARIYEDQTKP